MEDKRPPFIHSYKKAQPLQLILRRQTRCPTFHIHLQDRHVDPLTRSEILEFLAIDQTEKLKWQAEDFDCDDLDAMLWVKAKTYFRKRGKNAAFGITHIPAHRLTLYVEEPETGNKNRLSVFYVDPKEDYPKKPHKPARFILM
uniref:Uncharacterized protein n=1 Tax=Uncultured archaeon GZfos26G2 TaxID=3386331 RepID=Q648H5_UNCAG|nr:hypothetical protein GZ37D1_49 [uncultured archaeon GZfos37D1]